MAWVGWCLQFNPMPEYPLEGKNKKAVLVMLVTDWTRCFTGMWEAKPVKQKKHNTKENQGVIENLAAVLNSSPPTVL